MKIGNLETENNVFSAPMAGVSDIAYRTILKEMGAGLVFTEMVSSKALWYKDKKTEKLMKTNSYEKPVAIQVFGSDPEIVAFGAKAAQKAGADIVDINMGCPVPKVANNGDGSALLKNPELIGKIVKEVSSAVSVPVTCKIRSGFDEVCDVKKIASIIEENGAKAIAVHPRTRKMYYSGHSDWSIIADVKKAVTIPVIGNGDIHSGEDAMRMIDKTGCDAVMVGRAARGNPFIFREINSLLNDGIKIEPPSVKERMDVLKEHVVSLVNLKGEFIGVRESRKHIAWYIKSLKDSAAMRNLVCKIESFDELIKTLDEYTEFLCNEE